ncbi:MAG TPA: serine protease [Thermoanaerobaculia bacterium]|nr:serine protease [Thermoanaerobaculia bacterium]
MADRTVFVIRDFEVDRSVGLALQFLAQFPPAGTKLSIPGIPGAAEQGRLIEDVVDPALAKSQYVISFMDTPNANVGFELGFALGSDRHVALVCAATELPQWLDAAPLSGYLVAKGVQLPKLQRIIEQGEHVNVDGSPSRGSDLLFLSPRADEGLVGHALVARLYPDWRLPERTGWKLQDLPRQLDKVGEVVWLITPFAEGADRKDGQGNSLNAVIAGYAKGKGVPLRILKSTHHRRIVDIEDQANLFESLDELQNLLRVAEEKRKVTIAGSVSARRPVLNETPERIFSKEESLVDLNWYRRGLDIARAVGRLSIAGTAAGTCFLVSPRHVLTPWHVISSSKDAEDCAVVFESAGAGTGEIRRVKAVVWSSGSAELDATILELDAPVSDASAVSLKASKRTSLIIGDRVVVVGYPYGGALSFSLSESAIVAVNDHCVHYSTPTAPGSSGSPVFDRNWNLLAMHHALVKRQTQDGETVSEGIRASSILSALDQHPTIRSALTLVESK